MKNETPPMKIAIDARWIFNEISGIGTYTLELISHLMQCDKDNEYILLFNKQSLLDRTSKAINLTDSPNFKAELLPYGVFSILNQLLLPNTLKKLKIDLYHSTNYMIPIFAFPKNRAGRIKCVTTIHDVIPMVFPDHAPKSKKSRIFPIFCKIMVSIAARADAIIAVSKNSKSDIIKHLHIPSSEENKVRVIYNGISKLFKPGSSQADKDNDTPRYILYVGRFDPYKNVNTLVRAFANAVKSLPFPITLVLAGSPDPRYQEVQLLIEELNIQSAVKWTGYLTTDELISTYQNADILVHPSRYEGFGLQIGEAMACGIPVICSNAGSLPEVAGEAAIMIDPDNVAEFEKKIVEVLSSETTSSKMKDAGIAQAGSFNWKKTASETRSLYEEMK